MPANYLTGRAPPTRIPGYTPPLQLLQPPEFQSIAERDAWYRAHPVPHNTAASAPAFQPTDPNDPYYQRSDIAPLLTATNRDVMGNGRYGIRGFMRDHPVGVLGAFIGAAAGGAALSGGFGAPGAAATTAGGSATSGFPALAPGVEAGTGAGAASGGGLGVFGAGGSAGLAGVGGGNAGALAAAGGITGGAGTGTSIGGLLGAGTAAATGGSMGLWRDLLPGLVDLGGSLYQAHQAGRATDSTLAGINAGIGEQRHEFDTIVGLNQPQRDLGNSAINVLNRVNGYNTGAGGTAGAPDMSAFTTSPDYNFRRSEGLRDTQNMFAFRGGAQSGNAQRGIVDFNSNLASGEFNDFIQRRLQEAGLGGAATSNTSNAASSTGTNITNLLGQQGNARASGIVDQSNAVTGGLNNLANWYGNWRKNNQQYGMVG